MTAPPCTTRRTRRRKEQYSVSEQPARKKNVVHVFQSQNGRRRCYRRCRRHRHGRIDEGKDGARNWCRCPYRYGLGKAESVILERGVGSGDVEVEMG